MSNCSAVTVAVIDTGVDYNHPDLAANIWNNVGEIPANGIDDDGNGFIDDVQGWDFVQSDNAPMDFNEHGSHVAGTIGAVGNNGVGGTGICWSVKIMPVRALNSVGSGTTAGVVAGIDYAVANGAKLINMSLSGSGAVGDLLDMAIGNANAAGVLVVVAAGNSGADIDVSPTYPASYAQPNIITVAATDQVDNLATFSNFGAVSVDVAAPGVNIESTVPPARINNNSWNFDTGTATGWTLETRDNLGNLVPNTVAVSNEASLSPAFSLTDSPGGNYVVNRSYRAVSPAVNLAGKQGALLSFNFNQATEFGVDPVFKDISTDGGVTWLSQGGTSGTSGGWLTSSIDVGALDGLAAARFRFRLESNATNVLDGVHIDDVAISIPGTVYAGNEYTFLNGTSMATPHVAGLAALIWAAEPALTHLQVRTRILNTGDPLPSLPGKTATGSRINAQMGMPITAPTAVTLTPSAAGPINQVTVSWTDTSVSEESFLVQRDSGVGYVTLAILAANTTTYLDSSVPANVTNVYQVVAQSRDARIAVSAFNPSFSYTPAPAASGGGGGAVGLWSLFTLFVMLLLREFSGRVKK